MDYVVHNVLDRLRSRSMCHEFVSSPVEDHFRTTRKTTTTTTAASSFPLRHHRRWVMRTCDPVSVAVAAVDCGGCYCLDTTTGAFWRAIERIVDVVRASWSLYASSPEHQQRRHSERRKRKSNEETRTSKKGQRKCALLSFVTLAALSCAQVFTSPIPGRS